MSESKCTKVMKAIQKTGDFNIYFIKESIIEKFNFDSIDKNIIYIKSNDLIKGFLHRYDADNPIDLTLDRFKRNLLSNDGDESKNGIQLFESNISKLRNNRVPLNSLLSCVIVEKYYPHRKTVSFNAYKHLSIKSSELSKYARKKVEKDYITIQELSEVVSVEDIKKIPLNYILKGVPGTGKSTKIREFLDRRDIKSEDTVVINVNSESNNSDLVLGIGITNKNGIINYCEKKGPILKLIERAIENKDREFAVVIEEIQEKSLNAIIGNLIFLIDEDKRVSIKTIENLGEEALTSYEIIDKLISLKKVKTDKFITLPAGIENGEDKFMIIPDNIYFLCTTNYRYDKKILEDNFFRRFEIIDILPNENLIEHKFLKNIFKQINLNIEKGLNDEEEIDKLLIGHSGWMVKNPSKEDFFDIIYKFTNEFKEIRKIDYDDFKKILIHSIKKVEECEQCSEENKAWIQELNSLLENSKNYFQIIKRIIVKTTYKSYFGEL